MKAAIVFDADGVVIRSKPFTAELQRVHGVPASSLEEFFATTFPACITGKMALKDALEDLLPSIGWSGTTESFLQFWFEAENKPDPDLIQEIHSLRREGTTVCLATNQERHRLAFMRNEMGFSTLFDQIFASCELGYAKPDESFYTLATAALHVEGIERIVFFDDKEANVGAARQAGWEGNLYSSIDDFRNFNL